MGRAAVPDADPLAAERNEPWPGGRTNHYLFDMNRDWFVQSQHETRGRVRTFLEWHPQVVVDLHRRTSCCLTLSGVTGTSPTTVLGNSRDAAPRRSTGNQRLRQVPEGVHHGDSLEILTVGQVFGQQESAAGASRGGGNQTVPEREGVPVL